MRIPDDITPDELRRLARVADDWPPDQLGQGIVEEVENMLADRELATLPRLTMEDVRVIQLRMMNWDGWPS